MVTAPPSLLPTPLSAADLARTTAHLLALDAGPGAVTAVRAAREAVRDVPELTADPAHLRARGIHPADPDRTAALAELCEVIGWILFDAGLHRQAARANARALVLAQLAGDRATARLVLLNHSMLQTHTGHARAALESAARVVTPRTPHRVGTLVLIRRAHATALLGGHAEPLDLMARARVRFEDGISRHDPGWAWWIDEAELTGHRGWVHSRLRQWDRAIPLLHAAATAPGPAYRHLFTAELLSALARAGAWTETAGLIADIAPRVAGIGSVRTLETLGRTAAGLRRHARTPAPLRDAAVHLLESLPAPAARTAASAPHDR